MVNLTRELYYMARVNVTEGSIAHGLLYYLSIINTKDNARKTEILTKFTR